MKNGENIECPGCGAVIDPETLEATFPAGSEAASLDKLRAENVRFKTAIKRIAERYNSLLEKAKDNGKRIEQTGSGWKFPWE